MRRALQMHVLYEHDERGERATLRHRKREREMEVEAKA